MNPNGLILLKYQDSFADYMTSIAYAKIIEKTSSRKCYFENNTKERTKFEDKMSNFNLDFEFISASRVKEIT